jgi:hypothetical protein
MEAAMADAAMTDTASAIAGFGIRRRLADETGGRGGRGLLSQSEHESGRETQENLTHDELLAAEGSERLREETEEVFMRPTPRRPDLHALQSDGGGET